MVNKSPNPIDRHVGARVRMRRMMLHMSQGELGKSLGITFQQVQKYEKGTNRISASKLQQISQVLHVSVPFFFEGIPISKQGAASAADARSMANIDEFLATRDGITLTTAFMRIGDAKLRRRIVELVEQIEKSA